jgi:uncharacterized iron-regulated protein
MAVTAALLGILLGCAAPPSTPAMAPSTVFAASTTQAPEPAAVWRQLERLLPADALLMGEQHDSPEHQRLHRAVVEVLAERGILAAVALEMAEQGSSTAGLPANASEQQVRDALKWREVSWPWAAYGPAVMAAVHAGLPVLGANLPASETRNAMQSVAYDNHLTPGMWQKQQELIREGHCGLLPERQIVPMTRVQLARDAAMARTVRAARQAGKTVLLIAGNGHVNRELGVPTHLGHDLRVSALVLSPQRAPGATLDLPPADAVWLTPTLPPRDYCADLRSQMAPRR